MVNKIECYITKFGSIHKDENEAIKAELLEEEEEIPEEIVIEDSMIGEVRRCVNGVWQHKHEGNGYDYWHPLGRVHSEEYYQIGGIKVTLKKADNDKVIMKVEGIKDSDLEDEYPQMYYCDDNSIKIMLSDDPLILKECTVDVCDWIMLDESMSITCAHEIIDWIRKCTNNDEVKEMEESTKYMDILNKTLNPRKIDERLADGEDPIDLVIEKYELIKKAVEAGEEVTYEYYKADYCAFCHVYEDKCPQCPLYKVDGFKCNVNNGLWGLVYDSRDNPNHVEHIDNLINACKSMKPSEAPLDLGCLFDGMVNLSHSEGDIKVTVTNKMRSNGEKVQTIDIEGLTTPDNFIKEFLNGYPYYKTYDADNEVRIWMNNSDYLSIYIQNEREYTPEHINSRVEALKLAAQREREIKKKTEIEQKEWDGKVVSFII